MTSISARQADRIRKTAVWSLVALLIAILASRPIMQSLVALGVTIGWS
ncbi:hypothetical protein [Nocardia rhizosphaerae]|uniref:AI-2E family transporter n=1 Tax=Nocardia rhizosphaerae TaxID=1691571 RepID=A0ABV8L5D8_9NOCA